MDGGGRYLQPMTAYPAGVAVARVRLRRRGGAIVQSDPSRQDCSALAAACAGARPRVPLERRLPRFLGTGLALGFFARRHGVGLWQGGHLDDFIRALRRAAPCAGARSSGLGLEQVTISGIVADARERGPGGRRASIRELSLPSSTSNERARAPRARAAGQAAHRCASSIRTNSSSRSPSASRIALWQHNGELFVIAADGTVIDLMQDERFIDLPLRRGRGRQHAQQGLSRAARGRRPAQEPHPRRHAGRRAALDAEDGQRHRRAPAGAAAPPRRCARLVKLEREQKILEKDVLAIDLRMPDRVVVRLTEEAASARAEALKKKPMRGKGVDT